DFISVGTSIHRGEDLAVRGGTYIFDVAEVVQDTEAKGKRRHKLKLLCKEEAKGPITALCGINGYLVSSMGQKIFVRAFDLNERLVGVAFLDAGVYVTSIRCLKNFLMITDAVKSVWFVAFQEDPFKLIILSRDTRQLFLLDGEFFFAGNDLELVTMDDNGTLRLHLYDPTHLETDEGARLLCPVEFQTHSKSSSFIRIAKYDTVNPSMTMTETSRIVVTQLDGVVSILDSLSPEAFKRLSLLQSQLVRHVQHMAGLNPRSYRSGQSGSSGAGRSLSKGILDGSLLRSFKILPLPKQRSIASQIGETSDKIMLDCMDLDSEPW
ncbi:mRNA cleavage and polyadenylation factor subunit, partial [Serendipita sp. 399]